MDSEGFPRGDIDVYDVTHKRSTLATLNYDHKAIMKEIEALLPAFYAEQAAAASKLSASSGIDETASASASASSSSSQNNQGINKSAGSGTSSAAISSVFINFIPIAIIDEVFPQSPAALAGVMEGDALIKFADITQQSFEPFKRVSEHVGRSLNTPIELIINRKGEIISLSLTPKIWAGRGTLGCHLAPLNR